jgi:hypothetical protein
MKRRRPGALAPRIEEVRAAIAGARADPRLRRRLATRGYPAATLGRGLGLCSSAQDALEARQRAQRGLGQAASALSSAEQRAREHYTHFRRAARSALRDKPSVALRFGLSGRPAADRKTFLKRARRHYRLALSRKSYRDAFALHGMGVTEIKRAEGALATVERLQVAVEVARNALMHSESAQAEASAALAAWWAGFREAAA